MSTRSGAAVAGMLVAACGYLAMPEAQTAETMKFFPVAVWYGGGKARAPMLERQARSKKETCASSRKSFGRPAGEFTAFNLASGRREPTEQVPGGVQLGAELAPGAVQVVGLPVDERRWELRGG